MDMLAREGFTTSIMLDETTDAGGEGIVAAVRQPKGAAKMAPDGSSPDASRPER
jgi:hypothetical protein